MRDKTVGGISEDFHAFDSWDSFVCIEVDMLIEQ